MNRAAGVLECGSVCFIHLIATRTGGWSYDGEKVFGGNGILFTKRARGNAGNLGDCAFPARMNQRGGPAPLCHNKYRNTIGDGDSQGQPRRIGYHGIGVGKRVFQADSPLAHIRSFSAHHRCAMHLTHTDQGFRVNAQCSQECASRAADRSACAAIAVGFSGDRGDGCAMGFQEIEMDQCKYYLKFRGYTGLGLGPR